MSLENRHIERICSSFPRVSGDEPTAGGTAGDGTVFSPRERG